MPEIKDYGKVWIRGEPTTSFAVMVDDRVFVPGLKEGQSIDFWLEGDRLCVDLHNPKEQTRIARQFPLIMKPSHPATLFNGFEKTRHADVLVATYKDEGVKEKIFKSDMYQKEKLGSMDRNSFWRTAGMEF